MATTTVTSDLLEFLHIGQLNRNRRIYGCITLSHKPCPIQSLPNEILSYIFLSATHDSHDRFDIISSPIILSHVCSRWRHVALSTGSLWTSVILTFPLLHTHLSRTTAWLSRSKSCPLDILLDLRDPLWDWIESSHSFGGPEMERLLVLLLPHVKRWRRFELLTDTWAPIFAFLHHTSHIESAPILAVVSLARCNAYFAMKGEAFEPAAQRDPVPLFGGLGLPRLTEVSLAGVHVDWWSSALRNLTELELKYHASDVMPSVEQFRTILSACPELDSLTTIGWGPRFDTTDADDSTQTLKVMELPSLTRLFFGFLDVDYAIKFLDLLHMPALENLSLEDVSTSLNPVESLDATPLLSWLASRESSCLCNGCKTQSHIIHVPLSRITSISLEGISATISALSQFMSVLTSLRSLTLMNTDTNILQTFKMSQETGCQPDELPCPLLTDITCEPKDIPSICDIITTRSERCLSSLQRVCVDTADGEDIDISDVHRAVFTAAGIQLLSYV